MAELCFIDSNVWLYAFIENDDPQKRAKALSLIQNSDVVVSTQVINEVCVNLLRKSSVSETDLQDLINAFYIKYQVVAFNKVILIKASTLRKEHKLSYWDSLIVASALETSCNVLYSEDMHHGLLVEQSLQILNPFE